MRTQSERLTLDSGRQSSVGREADDTAELALGFDRPEARRY
jgi:hypothetical protein